MTAAASPGFWESFRAWRRTRPFWGGVVALLAAVELYSLTAAPFALVVIQGVAGISSIIIGLLILVLVTLVWFQPILRIFSGLAIVLLGLASILLTNLGGFLLGMILALVGGAMIAAWNPGARTVPAAGTGRSTPRPTADPAAADLPLFDDFAPRDPDASGTSAPAGPVVVPVSLDAPPRQEADAATGELPVIADQDVTGELPAVPDDAPAPAKRTPKGPASAMAVSLLAAALVSPATPVAAGAPATPAAPSSLICDLFSLFCPDPQPSTPAPAPAPSPSAVAVPVPSNGSGGSGSGGSGSGGAAGATPTPSGAPVDTSTLPSSSDLTTAACDPAAAPSNVSTSASAAKAASVVKACMDAGATTEPIAGDASGTIPLLAAQLTSIKAKKETLEGLSYQGIVTLNSRSGPVQVLKLTATKVTIEGIQEFVQADGVGLDIRAGGKATLSGTVHLYVVRQKGWAFGLLPLDLSPSSPPPIILPTLIFTDVDSQVAYLDAGALTLTQAQLTVV